MKAYPFKRLRALPDIRKTLIKTIILTVNGGYLYILLFFLFFKKQQITLEFKKKNNILMSLLGSYFVLKRVNPYKLPD